METTGRVAVVAVDALRLIDHVPLLLLARYRPDRAHSPACHTSITCFRYCVREKGLTMMCGTPLVIDVSLVLSAEILQCR